jgi:serpin B
MHPRTTRFFPLFLVLACACCSPAEPGGQEEAQEEMASMQRLARGNNALAWRLFARLRRRGPDLFLSPYSIRRALAMVAAGAAGETAAEMRDPLGLFAGYHRAAARLAARLARQGAGVSFTQANATWVQEGMAILDPFRQVLADHYGAGLERVDFKADPAAAARRIDRWAAEATRGLIKQVMPPGAIDPMTRMVLANAIHFKGLWAHAFAAERTRARSFFPAGGESYRVQMMHLEEEFRLGENGHMQVLELPYKGGDFAMNIYLPRERQGCAAMETRFAAGDFSRVPEKWRRREVEVHLPRFHIECSFRLAGALRALGIEQAFDRRRADFSRINGRRDLFLDEVVHKAVVKVDEKGTEAAAVTAPELELKEVPDRPLFRADHPFLFTISHNPSGTILFLGRVGRPAAAELEEGRAE